MRPAYLPSFAVYELPSGEFNDLRQRVVTALGELGWERCAPGYCMDIDVDLVPHGYTLGFHIGRRPATTLAAALDPDGRPVKDGIARQILAGYRPPPLTAGSDLAEGFPRAVAACIAEIASAFHAQMCRPA